MTAPVIAVGGEALIDLIPDGDGLHPHPGGGPFNTAVSLGRLGVPTAFVGRLSSDAFGRMLEARLAESGVDGRYILHGDAPTPLALVQPASGGDHEFSFYLSGTSYADVAVADLPLFEPDVGALYVGTLALATDPPAAAFEHLIEREATRRLVVVDPNIRPAACGEPSAYLRRFESWAGQAHVLKLSDDDAAWLYPGSSHESVLDTLLGLGPQLVVLTLGAEGAVARTSAANANVPAPRVTVVDTVGAGDAFSAGLLRRLWEKEWLDSRSVAAVGDDELADLMRFAAAVAALQCSRAGASPPTLGEVTRFLA